MLKGVVIGAISGAIMGGLSGYAQNGVNGILGGILHGIENGALMGLAFGGLGGFGSVAGKLFGCSSFMTGLFYGSSVLSIGMLSFDLLALVYGVQSRFKKDTSIDLRLIDPTAGKFISDLNCAAHENPWYNAFQFAAGATAVFSGGYVRSAACFIAGTLIATVDGLKPIETIKAGDLVLSADVETMQTAYKPVLETYVRKVDRLVQLTVNGELIITTEDHPFYVYGQGFVNAAMLCMGSPLIDNNGNKLCIEYVLHEQLHNVKQTVYNFQVEENHTYYVGNNSVMVHNAGTEYDIKTVETEKGEENIPVIKKPGSPSWKQALNDLRTAKGKGNNFVVRNEAEAEMLINEARPDLPKSPTYDPNAPKSNYQIHPIDNDYGMPHIKFEDWSGGKKNGFAGHIFWED